MSHLATLRSHDWMTCVSIEIALSPVLRPAGIEREINDVKAQLVAVELELKDLLSADVPEDRKQRLQLERLVKKEEQLRDELKQLREMLLVQLRRQQPGLAGALPEASLSHLLWCCYS